MYDKIHYKLKKNKNTSILWYSAFFMVQLSHPYMTTGKTIALIRWAFVGKLMSLLFNMLSSLVTVVAIIYYNDLYWHYLIMLIIFPNCKFEMIKKYL